MKNYETIEESLTIDRIHREIETYCMRSYIDPFPLKSQIEIIRFHEEAGRRMVLQFMARVASKKYDVKTVRFPSDWWQAFKKRFFPGFALAKWPVKYTEFTMEANAYHPDIAIPDRATFVDILMTSRQY